MDDSITKFVWVGVGVVVVMILFGIVKDHLPSLLYVKDAPKGKGGIFNHIQDFVDDAFANITSTPSSK